jgi:hypothetical protein
MTIPWWKQLITVYLFYTWYMYTSLDLKIRSVLYASFFSIIEYSWYGMTTEQPDGSLKFTPFSTTSRKPFTTFAMWVANLLYTPIMIDFYLAFISNRVIQIALFPITIWIGEIIMGYYLIHIYGKINPRAWIYFGDDTYFDGNIKLGHRNLWWGLGAVTVLIYPKLVSFSGDIATQILHRLE